MRTPLLIGIVVAVHCVAVGSVVLIQGCGTPTVSRPAPRPKMPMVESEKAKHQPGTAAVQKQVKPWPAQTTRYVVGKGDSLSGIAVRYGVSVAEIAALSRISNPNVIRSGQELILPGRINLDASALPRKRQIDKPVAGGNLYIVKPGDTLSAIAARYGTTVDGLLDVNNLSTDRIVVGRKLAIPDGSERRGSSPYAGIPATPDTNVDIEPGSLASVEKPAEEKPVFVRIHVVELDEDLQAVAMMWGVSVSRIKELNKLTDTSLTPGQRLKIPLTD